MANNFGGNNPDQWERQDGNGHSSHFYPHTQPPYPQDTSCLPLRPLQSSPFYQQTQIDGNVRGSHPHPFTQPCPQYSQSMPTQPCPFYYQYHSDLRGPPHPAWRNVLLVQVTQFSPQRNYNGRQISTPTTAGRSNRRRTSETDSVFTRAPSQSCQSIQSNLGRQEGPIHHLLPSFDHKISPRQPPIHSNLEPPVPIRRYLPSSFEPKPKPQFGLGDFPTLEYATALPSQQSQPCLPSPRSRSRAQTLLQQSQPSSPS